MVVEAMHELLEETPQALKGLNWDNTELEEEMMWDI